LLLASFFAIGFASVFGVDLSGGFEQLKSVLRLTRSRLPFGSPDLRFSGCFPVHPVLRFAVSLFDNLRTAPGRYAPSKLGIRLG
jgi:hypothetical protein